MAQNNLVSPIIDTLNKLKSVDHQQPNFMYSCENVLLASYNAGRNNAKFDDQEQLEIGLLLSENIKKLDNFIFQLGFMFDIDKGPSALICRSGLQYILENFKDFPTGKGDNLENTLGIFIETESLETFDEALQKWKEDTTVGYGNVGHTKEVLERPADIPESHTWWF